MRPTTSPVLLAAALCGAQALLLSSRSAARNLIINEVSARNRDCVVVHEIVDDDGKADAVRSIERTRDRFWSGQDIIDATTTDDSALGQKLKKGFTLYTTISDRSRLFKATTQPLGIEIEGDTLRWRGVAAPVSELRIIAVGKNPYGAGNCVVYAAGTGRLLDGVNGCFHGPCSYHIFQGDKLLKEGFYRDDFTAAPDRLSREQAEADIKQFFATLQRVHPDLLAKVSLDDYIKLKQQTADDVAQKLDTDGKISVNDLAYVLFYAAAFFGDGHTQVQWRYQPNESSTAGVRFPPFLLGYDNGRFVATAAADKGIEGLEVVSMDRKPTREFLSPILDRCSGETLVFKASRFTHEQCFWYSLSKLCGSAESLRLGLRGTGGRESEQTVATVSFADFQKLSSDGRASRLEQMRQQGTRVEFLDSDRIAHFIYPGFKLSDEEKKKVDSVFEQIKARKSRELIIDLRGNGGGNSSMGDFIFGYLYGKPFCSFSKARIKLSRDVTSAFLKDGELGSPDLEGLTITFVSGKEESVAMPNAFFSGRAFLLVDNGTFSSAADFTAMFRDYAVGTIIGHETGGLPVCFGDIYPFNLENSGINIGVSYKQFFGPKPRPGDNEHGIIPDIPMTDELLRPYQKEDDPVLAFALHHVRKTRRSR